MILSEIDINSIRNLTGIPLNHRDASMGSTGGADGPWKKVPTRIQTPSNRLSNLNPYSGRTGDNLRDSNHARNATLIPVVNSSSHNPPPHNKRKRVDATFSDPPVTPSNLRPSKRRGVAPKIVPEIIQLVDDDEDIGVPVIQAREPSPDPLSVISKTPGKHERPVSGWQPTTTRLSGNSASSPSSPIESADGITEDVSSPGIVKKMVKQYEKKEANGIPHLDLHRKMKPKGGRAQGKVPSTFETHITPQEPPDAIATAPTLYHRGGGKGKQREKPHPQEHCLPVKEWCLGFLHYEEPCHLYFSSASQFIRIDGPSYSEELPLSLIKSIELPSWRDHFDFTSASPIIKLKTLNLKRENFGAHSGAYFTTGENFKGFVTFKLDPADESWSEEGWKCLADLLKGAVPEGKGSCQHYLGMGAGNAMWHFAHNQVQATYSNGEVAVLRKSDTPEGLHATEEKGSSSTSSRPGRTSTPSSSHSTDAKASRNRPSKPEPSSKPNPFQPKQSVKENHASGLRRSSRYETPAKQKSPIEDPEEVILCYPPATTGAVNITNGDLSRLQPGEYLNDTLIEFGLKLWHKELEQNSPELAEQIYIFNSFFYKKLNKKNIEESYKTVARWTNKIDIFKKKYVIVPINENFHWYLAVIYQPEYALLPPEEKPVPATRGRTRLSQAHDATDAAAGNTAELNDPSHDQLEELTVAGTSDTAVGVDSAAVALNTSSNDDDEPDMNIVATATVSHDDDMESVTAMDCDEEDAESAASVTAHLTQPDASVADDDDINMAEADDLNMAEDDKATVVDIEEAEAREEPQNAVGAIPPDNFYGTTTSGKEKEGISEPLEIKASEGGTPQPLTTDISKPIPYIFIMDSLCQKHPKVVSVLSSYLKYEAIEKKKKEATDITKPAGKYAQVPLQPNFCDCGLYLLHFARTFVEKTDYLVKIMTRDRSSRTPQADRHEDWNARGVEGHRQQMAERIKELSTEWRKEKATREAEEELDRKKREAIEVPDSDSDDEMEIVQENLATSKKKPTKTYASKQNTNRPSRLR